jgi:hypothetical protein
MRTFFKIIILLEFLFLIFGLKCFAQKEIIKVYHYGNIVFEKFLTSTDSLKFSGTVSPKIRLCTSNGIVFERYISEIDSIKFYEYSNSLPIVTTKAVSNITENSASLRGEIIFGGAPEYVERGVCYSTSPNPTINNTKLVVLGNGIGEYSTTANGLNLNTVYYVRAYAINEKGIAYGNEIAFALNDACYGNIILSTEEEIIALKVAGCKYIIGNVIVTGNTLQTLSLLDNQIKEISGNFIFQAENLSTFDGLYSLEKVGGNFAVLDGRMTIFEGCNNLQLIGGDFTISSSVGSLYSLISFAGLGNLQAIGGDFSISTYTSLSSLTSFTGLESLYTIGGNFTISAIGGLGLTSFAGLGNLQSIGGNFTLSAASNGNGDYSLNSLKSFTGLESLHTIGGNFTISASSHVTSYTHYSLNALTSFLGLENLQSIGGDFIISSIANSYSFYYNSYPTSYSLNALTSFTGLGNLQTIGGNFLISSSALSSSQYPSYSYSLKSLKSFTGLESLQCVGGNFSISSDGYCYQCSSLGDLNSFSGLESLQTIGGNFSITTGSNSFSKLTSFSGLNNLKSIGSNFSISAFSLSALTSFSGLENIQSIGGNFEIEYANKLADIVSLSQITNIKGISFINCNLLFNFCPIVPAVQNMTGSWLTTGCGYNPTKYQMLNGACQP